MWQRVLICFLATTVLSVSRVPAAAPNSEEAAAKLDQLLEAETSDDTVDRAAIVDDATFLRRVFLDLTGGPPASNDISAFDAMSGDKRSGIVEELLRHEAFGKNAARYWRDVIMYRRTEERALVGAASLTEYLTRQVNHNVSWSKIATDLITATGDVRENGATGLIMAQAGMPEDVTAEVSRIFLGIQIQCAQCHDHPTDRWKREQFHELAAFFPRIAVRPDRSSDVPTFLVTVNDRLFAGRRNNNAVRFAGTPEHYMPDLDNPSERGTRMQPTFFLSGQTLRFGATDKDRRSSLAEWITAEENEWFAKAFVNRIWAELVGEGFYEPIDDLGPDRQCSAPQTLDYLAAAFAEGGHDVKWLYRTIMATDAYQRASRPRRNFDDTPFQANCAQRLRGDQLYDSLLNALDLPERALPSRRGGPYLQRNDARALFNAVFGFDPSDPREEVGGSIQQALALMNSPMINRAVSARRPEGLGRILREHNSNQDALAELYQQVLSRPPSDDEVRTCLSYVREVGDRREAFEDILWSLVNSTEFLHRK